MNIRTEAQPSTSAATEKALSFISKGWREVKDSADADFQLMRNRANSFKNIATSFDRELENFINSASSFSVPAIRSTPPTEIDFVKRLQPKLSELRRAYSSPDFSRKVLDKWKPRSRIRIDLSAIRSAIVSEVEEETDGIINFDDRDRFWGRTNVIVKDFRWDWKGDSEESQKEWEPIRALKTRLKEFERKSSSAEIFRNITNNEFMQKLKSSLVRFEVRIKKSPTPPPPPFFPFSLLI
ncbi:digalactosyldiacylglycerol synthase 1, chloroplastic-like [Macadamia integrifolia]|uniref:digalactosyldiacylglycerol synthase 1, chloroplastic-like n=1 Tax=Macadamia integrifolia TaxID=60698 RepID=UPI001C52B3C1|nr:digalactosyldiacylglycerol synthase 1, chloroplastic-like [Macadamia integrifolia]